LANPNDIILIALNDNIITTRRRCFRDALHTIIKGYATFITKRRRSKRRRIKERWIELTRKKWKLNAVKNLIFKNERRRGNRTRRARNGRKSGRLRRFFWKNNMFKKIALRGGVDNLRYMYEVLKLLLIPF
jgi:hypothetical protein